MVMMAYIQAQIIETKKNVSSSLKIRVSIEISILMVWAHFAPLDLRQENLLAPKCAYNPALGEEGGILIL
jgi:hypothetical protein